MSDVPPRPGRGPLAFRVVLVDDDGVPAGGFDLTEAGTKKGLAVYVARDPSTIAGIARLGPEPLDDAFTVDTLAAILSEAGGRQLKGVLREQATIAGIGNAYSDDILHAARLSPFKAANKLEETDVATLYAAIRDVLTDAVTRSAGLGAGDLKAEKKLGMRVHGRTGSPCPVCGDVIREVSFADSSLQYCPTCQTDGKPLADRRLSKLLK
jgi:formamidopyrimidine-DNA glycosylase